MKRLSLLGLLLATFAVAARPASIRTTLGLTSGVPSDDTAGLNLDGAQGYHVIVTAPSGQTITGGTARCYYKPRATNRYTPCPASLDVTLRTGQRDAPSTDFRTTVSSGQVFYATDTVTLSGGGTSVDVNLEAYYP